MNKAQWVVVALAVILVSLIAVLLRDRGQDASLTLFCAAGMRVPVTTIAERYEEEVGISVKLHFAGSGTLLSSLDVAPADLFLAADESYVEIAITNGWVSQSAPISYLTAGIGVAKDNPKSLQSLGDLLNDSVRVGLARPEDASVGKFGRTILKQVGLWDALSRKANPMTLTVTDLANAIKLEVIDAAIVWDAVANQYPEVAFVHVPEFDRARQQVTIGITTRTKDPAAAWHFIRYLTASDRGLPVFESEGYQVLEGDAWEPDE